MYLNYLNKTHIEYKKTSVPCQLEKMSACIANVRRMHSVQTVLPSGNKEVWSRGYAKLSFLIAGDKPGEEKIPLVAAYLRTRTTISAFKISSNLEEVIVCAFPSGTKLKFTQQR
jgi:hypothetical protein